MAEGSSHRERVISAMTVTGTGKTFVKVVAMADIKMGTVMVISGVSTKALGETMEKVVRGCTKMGVEAHPGASQVAPSRLQYILPIRDNCLLEIG